jgi:hypothetical protein
VAGRASSGARVAGSGHYHYPFVQPVNPCLIPLYIASSSSGRRTFYNLSVLTRFK